MDLVSCIITNYNNSEYITKAINSIKKQSYQNIEIIVIDDNSTDNSLKILSKIHNIKVYVNKKNIGLFLTRNKAIKLAKGKYISFMDSDDIIDLNKIENDIKYLKENDKIWVVSKFVRINEKNKIITKPEYCVTAFTAEKNIFNLVGYFYNTRFGGDVEFWERIKILIPDKIGYREEVEYFALDKNNGKQLTKQYNYDLRIKFLNKFREEHKKLYLLL